MMTRKNKMNGFAQSETGASRRGFLGYLGLAPSLTRLAGAGLLGALRVNTALADLTPINDAERRRRAFALRRDAALYEKDRPDDPSMSNGDEERYPNRIASFSKALPHNNLGEVDLKAYGALIQALGGGRWSDFEAIPMGGASKLSNPQSAYCFSLEGADAAALSIPAPPTFNSAQMAAEIAEDYWYALTRDVPFSLYGTDTTIAQAAADLSKFSDYRGPKVNGQVTPDVIFRGSTPGDLTGPYISQFLLKPTPFGATMLPQLYRTSVAGDDHLTSYQDWLNVQKGGAAGSNMFDSAPRYIRNNRDLSLYLLVDFSGQANIQTALQLSSYGNAALSPNNPYLHSATQVGNVTFGGAMWLDFAVRAANPAQRANFFQKWLVHRRIRPEAFAGRIHNHVTGAASYPIHSDILNSAALKAVFSAHGTYLLPMAYPAGSPVHPSYPAAHATTAGCGITMLKALFNESFVIPNPVVASDDGMSLLPYNGPALTVGNELNKLASNIALGRDAAGVHYRSDGIQGILLGEAIALSILRETATLYNEEFPGFTLTRFDGRVETICPYC
jgi:hypothetical protein